MRIQAPHVALLFGQLLRQSEALGPVEIRGVILPAPKPIEPIVRPPPEVNPGSETPRPATEPESETPGAALRPDPEGGSDPAYEIPGVITPHGVDSVVNLGDYEAYEDAPFSSYDGEWDPFFSKIFDVFEAESTGYYENNALAPEATKAGGPLQSGRPTSGQVLSFTATASSGLGSEDEDPTVTTFNPLKPTDVCAVMSSLMSYCSGGGTDCACYSGTYYVPDQWNTLAARCAAHTSACGSNSTSTSANDTATATTGDWCQVASLAASYQSYCPVDSTSTVAFAAQIVLATTTTDSGGATTSATSTSAYMVAASNTISAQTTSTYVPSSSGGVTRRARTTGVWSVMLMCLAGVAAMHII